MSTSDYAEALELLDSAAALLERRDLADASAFARELRRLSLQLDLLRARSAQAPADSCRN